MAGIEWDIHLEGLDETVAAIEAARPIALARGAEHVRGVSVDLAPVLNGDLRASAGVTVYNDEAQVTYDSVYARYQHYGLDFQHPQGGQALFLEQPMITEAETVAQIMADTIREAL